MDAIFTWTRGQQPIKRAPFDTIRQAESNAVVNTLANLLINSRFYFTQHTVQLVKILSVKRNKSAVSSTLNRRNVLFAFIMLERSILIKSTARQTEFGAAVGLRATAPIPMVSTTAAFNLTRPIHFPHDFRTFKHDYDSYCIRFIWIWFNNFNYRYIYTLWFSGFFPVSVVINWLFHKGEKNVQSWHS